MAALWWQIRKVLLLHWSVRDFGFRSRENKPPLGAAQTHCCDRPKCYVTQFVQWLSVDGILIYIRNLCMGFTFSWFRVACKEGFWEEAFGVLQMGREQQVCLSVVSALCRLPAQTCDQTICFHTSRLSRVRQGLSSRTGKSFLQAGIRNGCRCGAVNSCSHIWTRWAMYILRNVVVS